MSANLGPGLRRGDMLDTVASQFTRLAIANVTAEYPNKLDHLLNGASDVQSPAALHPVFYGSYDWHSSVHMHWTLVELFARAPSGPQAAAIATTLDAHFTDARIAVECAYLDRPGSRAFERPYGWAWLLKLAAALRVHAGRDAQVARWGHCLQPLADRFVARFVDYLPKADYPSRAGMHGNSAFALLLALDYAEAADDATLKDAIVAKAVQWFADDRDYPVAYEISSEDFLSSGLVEAALMRRVFGDDAARFAAWWRGFVPDPARHARWLSPVEVSDRSDPRIAHLDGLNLSRAWCWTLLADAVADPRISQAIDDHLAASLPHAAEGEYVGTHWLASFALLALLA